MLTGDLETKTQGMHYSNILIFEKYFKVPYDLFFMGQTVREASEVLEEKHC